MAPDNGSGKDDQSSLIQSWKAEVSTVTSLDEWVSNRTRFPTREQAELYAIDLSLRWPAVRHWRVAPSDDEPNYIFADGVAVFTGRPYVDRTKKSPHSDPSGGLL